MSFPNKTNGRSEYLSRSNSNPNKNQTMNYRNIVTNNQHSNGNNGETYSYDEKSQHSCISPKIVTENHGMSQHNTSPRDIYYKNNNIRAKQYHPSKTYNEKHGNYYNQRPSSPDDIIIPEIEHLKEFVKEQTDRFKLELSRHENQKSSSPSPSSHHYNDQTNYKYNKTFGSLGRAGNGFPVSHSLGSIANNSSGVMPASNLTVSPSCLDTSNRHQDVRLGSQQNSFTVTKNSNGYSNYNNYPPSSKNNSKPSPGLTRNLSNDETFSKSPNNLNTRNDSPNNNSQNVEKNIKTQFPSPTNSSAVVNRQDPKKAYYRSSKPFSFAAGSNPAMHQINQNNSVTANIVTNEGRKNDQLSITTRPTMSSVLRNSSGPQRITSNRRGYGPPVGYENSGGDAENQPAYRAVVSLETLAVRRTSSNHSNIVDDQDNIDNHPPEQFFTPEPSGSPCSTTRSSPESTHAVAPNSQTRQH